MYQLWELVSKVKYAGYNELDNNKMVIHIWLLCRYAKSEFFDEYYLPF